MKLTEDNIEIKPRILDGFEDGKLTNIIIETRPPFDKQLKQQILENEKLRELVEEGINRECKETCFGIPVNAGIVRTLQSLLDQSKGDKQ